MLLLEQFELFQTSQGQVAVGPNRFTLLLLYAKRMKGAGIYFQVPFRTPLLKDNLDEKGNMFPNIATTAGATMMTLR